MRGSDGSVGMRRLVVPCVLLLAMAGCSAPDDLGGAEAGDRMGRVGEDGFAEEDAREFVGEAVSFAEASFSGVIVARTTGDPAMYEGDRHSFCVVVPAGVREVSFTLAWPEPRPLLLEFTHTSEPERYTSYEPPVGYATSISPVHMTVQDPSPGEWQVWVGWGLDLYRPWELEMRWASADPAFTLEETHSDDVCN